MPRYKQYNYSQTALIPIDLEKQIIPGSLEYAIHKLVEERVKIDSFEKKLKNDETGRPAYDPKVMLKIILLGYSKGIISSRKIEAACKENILFMAISCQQCPDHSKIAEFISTMKEEIKPLFRDILLVCEELKLLGGTSFALDGLKLPSNASKHWSGTHEELKNKKEKLEKKIAKLIIEHQSEDKKEDKKGEKKEEKNEKTKSEDKEEKQSKNNQQNHLEKIKEVIMRESNLKKTFSTVSTSRSTRSAFFSKAFV